MSNDAFIERRAGELGYEILERARAAAPRVWEQAWWRNRIMDWSADHERLRVQMFRFIDVLPALHDEVDIARHLAEYLDAVRGDMPTPLRLAVGFNDPHSWHARTLARWASRAAQMAAQTFIAGSNAQEATRTVRRFRDRSMAFTLDVLGEYTTSDSQADRYLDTYLDLIESLCPIVRTWDEVPVIDTGATGPMPRVNISIKLTALTPGFDAIDPERSIERAGRRLRVLLRQARALGAFINVDMESFGYRDLTIELFTRVLAEDEFRDFTDVGIVVQAYLTDAENDYHRLLDWVKHRGPPISVRLVKGAYWDMETALAAQNNTAPPVWTQKWQSDACFERITRMMLENHRWIRPAFASHNVRSLAVAMATAESLGLTPAHYELQMLNGMGDPLKQAVVDMGRCLRVYTPYGDLISGIGYLIRRLLENTANDSFLVQSYNVRDASGLLADPVVSRPPSAPPRQSRFADVQEDEPMPEFKNEPVVSFTRQSDRDKFAAALKFVRGEFGKEYPLVIDGQRVRTGSWIDSVNPSTPVEIVGRAAAAGFADADRAVAAAKNAFADWRKTDPVQRADFLRKAADLIRRRRFEFDAYVTFEAAKPWREADADIAEAIDYLVYYAAHTDLLATRQRRRDLPGEDNYLIHEPKGVCVVIAPWAFPLALLTNMVAAALVTGNTVVMKPSSATPVVAAKLMEAFESVGLPAGVLNYLPSAGSAIGKHLVEHPDVNVVSFTGSRDVGVTVMQAAQETSQSQQQIKRVITELGGKNAIIVDADADLDEAVGGVVKSAFAQAGQKCTSCSRVIVLSDVHDAFCDRLTDAVNALPIGPAEDPGTVVGPIIDAESRKRIREYVEIGRNQGRVILERQPGPIPGGGFYVGPVIIADVDPNAPIAQEEIFGPVLSVLKADDFDHAIQLANGTRYALTGGVYSRSPAHIDQAKRDFLVGNLYINRKITGSRVDVEPFGGLKMSGNGAKVGGPDYLHYYCDTRTITEHTLRHGLAPAEGMHTKA